MNATSTPAGITDNNTTLRGINYSMTSSPDNNSSRPMSDFLPEILTFSLIWLFSVFGNILVCVVIHRSRRLQSTTNYFVVSLAAGDLIFTFLCMPFILGQVLAEEWVFGQLLCKVVRFLQFLLPSCMMFIWMAICVDRFYTIIYPLSFKVTRHRAKQLICLSWVIAMLLASPCFYFYDLVGESGSLTCTSYIDATTGGIVYLSFITTLVFIVPTIIIVIGYSKIFRFIWRSGIGGRTFQRTINTVPRPKVKIVKMIMVVNAASVTLILPWLIAHLWYCSDQNISPNPALYTGVVWTTFVSAVSKPGIYTCYNSNFRRGCREVFCMSNMKCYRSNAYTITTASTFSKKNYVGVVDGIPSRDHRRVDSPSKTFDRSALVDKYAWPLSNNMNSTYL